MDGAYRVRQGAGQLWASEGQEHAVCSGSVRRFVPPVERLCDPANGSTVRDSA